MQNQSPNFFFKKTAFVFIISVIAAALVIIIFYSTLMSRSPIGKALDTSIQRFGSEQKFREYLSEVAAVAPSFRALDSTEALPAPSSTGVALEQAPNRFSQTNVQVRGVDEPDIVKTDGENIYFSSNQPFRILEESVFTQTKIINAFPPDGLELDSEITEGGELLLTDNTLITLANDKITGFDVTTPKNPKKEWSINLDNTFVETARLTNGNLYLITRKSVNPHTPCPIPLLSQNGRAITIACDNIFHPVAPMPVDSTFTALRIDPETGAVESQVSFVGTAGSSVVYVSESAIYITYTIQSDMVSVFYNFYTSDGANLLPASVISKLQKLISYDISNQSKFMELNTILNQYKSTLDSDEMLKLNNETNNKLTDYIKTRSRQLQQTGIIKVLMPSLQIAAKGAVGGIPLNQFSLDEYADNLRIATNIGNSGIAPVESENDLYILNSNLEELGSIKGFGLDERIFAARFIGDKAYVVTFKQIDPFFVMDLSDPKSPRIAGKLKIPGFSSYLHPVTSNLILGVGKEDQSVKLSLFDVTNTSKPNEIAKYTLDEFWTDVQSTHHAFLLDSKHKAFFIPGGKGEYIFSYENSTLNLERAIANVNASRAVFIDDFMYIIGQNKIEVIDETNWETVAELDL